MRGTDRAHRTEKERPPRPPARIAAASRAEVDARPSAPRRLRRSPRKNRRAAGRRWLRRQFRCGPRLCAHGREPGSERLAHDRKRCVWALHRSAVRGQAQHIAIDDSKRAGVRRRDADRISPNLLCQWLGQLLQPGVVGERSVVDAGIRPQHERQLLQRRGDFSCGNSGDRLEASFPAAPAMTPSCRARRHQLRNRRPARWPPRSPAQDRVPMRRCRRWPRALHERSGFRRAAR